MREGLRKERQVQTSGRARRKEWGERAQALLGSLGEYLPKQNKSGAEGLTGDYYPNPPLQRKGAAFPCPPTPRQPLGQASRGLLLNERLAFPAEHSWGVMLGPLLPPSGAFEGKVCGLPS